MAAPNKHSSADGLETLSGLVPKIGQVPGVPSTNDRKPNIDGPIQQSPEDLAKKVVELEDRVEKAEARVKAVELGITEILMRRDSGEHPKVASGE